MTSAAGPHSSSIGGCELAGPLPGFPSGGVLCAGFAGAAFPAGLVLLPHWNRLPRAA
ncbi:hypothetical protein AB0M87_14350 [Streptomyces sp. NPDC051320]|uniref:hypothetical protein n=1 Tax=Streptomyces sp. NPDC051320 TaxID=3154644 RepID=UPI00343570BA